jgi:hypothetical protein
MNHAVRVVEHQIRLNMAEMTELEGQDMRLERMGVGPGDQRRKDIRKRLTTVNEATRGWRNKYFALTGIRWTAVEMPPLEVKENGQRIWEDEQKRQAKSAVARVKPGVKRAMILEYRERIRQVEQTLFLLRAQVKDALSVPANIFEDTGKAYSATFAFEVQWIPWSVKNETIPRVEQYLESARQALEKEKSGENFRMTHRALMKSAQHLNDGLALMTRYHDRMQQGGKQAIAYIKWGSAAVTGVVAAPASGAAAILVGMAGKAGEEGGTLAARYLNGETLSRADVEKLVGEVLIAGGAAGVGQLLGKLAGPIAGRIFKSAKPTAAQIKAVEHVLGQLGSNNFEQAVKAVDAMIHGKPISWDWWASAVAPLLPPGLTEGVKDQDVRDGVTAK